MTPDATSVTLHEAARLALKEHRYADAARVLERAVAHDPNDAWAHDKLGIAYQRLGREDDALEQFEQAVNLAPDNPVYRYNLGAMLVSAGQNEEGCDHLHRCLELDPNHSTAKDLLNRLCSDSHSGG